MTQYRIPLINVAQQLTISLAGVTYSLTVKWNSSANCWVVDIGDQNGVLLVGAIALVTGTDLLGQYGYLNFGGQLIAATDFNPDAPPTYSNLGTTGTVTFVTTP
jgi:hypothetical protein